MEKTAGTLRSARPRLAVGRGRVRGLPSRAAGLSLCLCLLLLVGCRRGTSAARRLPQQGAGSAPASPADRNLSAAAFAPAAASAPVYFISDRHGLSYGPVKDFCESAGCRALLLFDRHNDVGADSPLVASCNWVGQLVDGGLVDEVFWVCRSAADPLELAAKRRWLEENVGRKEGEGADRVLRAFRILDFRGLEGLALPQPCAATVDLDVYDDPSEGDPLRFIEETCAFLRAGSFPLVTVALSAAYQKSPAAAWGYLEHFMRNVDGGARWFFRSGAFGEREESREDLAAFARWREDAAAFQGYRCSFYRGAYLWLAAPPAVQDLFVGRGVRACRAPGTDGGATQAVLAAMAEGAAAGGRLSPFLQKERLSALHAAALSGLREAFAGGSPPPPGDAAFFPGPGADGSAPDGVEGLGIAVRYRTALRDRGCLALCFALDPEDMEQAARYCSAEAAHDPRYGDIAPGELEGLVVNISVFGPWNRMPSWEDFVPGLDSLVLVNLRPADPLHRVTLLQASLALERGYTKEEFLRRLCAKAALDEDAYLGSLPGPPLVFYRARTVSYTAPVLAP